MKNEIIIAMTLGVYITRIRLDLKKKFYTNRITIRYTTTKMGLCTL